MMGAKLLDRVVRSLVDITGMNADTGPNGRVGGCDRKVGLQVSETGGKRDDTAKVRRLCPRDDFSKFISVELVRCEVAMGVSDHSNGSTRIKLFLQVGAGAVDQGEGDEQHGGDGHEFGEEPKVGGSL